MQQDQTPEQRAVEGASAPRGSRKNRDGASTAQSAQRVRAPSSTEAQEQFRVVISREANVQLEKSIAKTCQGFEPGAVTRTDIANYVFCNLAKLLTDIDYKALRALHFDEKKILSSILKSESDLPEEIRKALREHYGLAESGKKRALRAAPEQSTEAPVDAPPAA